jgi:hypothetical protein
MSSTDVFLGEDGNHHFYHSKDLYIDNKYQDIKPEHDIIKMVDVDYYVDLPFYISYMKPIIMYTLSITDLTYKDDECHYSISNDVLTHHLIGNGKYKHKLWKYDQDHILVHYGLNTYYCSLDIRPVDKIHMAVLIVPERKIYTPIARLFFTQNLHRLSTKSDHPDFNLLTFRRHDKTYISLSRVSFPNDSALIPLNTFQCIKGNLDHDKKAILATVERFLRTINESTLNLEIATATQLCFDYIQATAGRPIVYDSDAFALSDADVNYRPSSFASIHGEEVKSYGRLIMKPILDEGKVPTFGPDSDRVIISERLYKVAPQEQRLKSSILNYMEEFAKLLIPKPHTLTPLSEEQVDEVQVKPTQRSSFERVLSILGWRIRGPQAFQKKEPYSSIKAPRNITNCSVQHRVRYSRYTFPLATLLKSTEWYAFGNSPSAIATKVHEICQRSTTVLPTDFSKFDGTHSYALHILEKLILLRAYSTDDANEIMTIMASEINQKVKTAFEIEYTTLFSRLSGSPGTSLFNSIDNAFIAYIAYRLTGLAPVDAYKHLGVYGGDDGISPDLSSLAFANACTLLGCIPKAAVQSSDEPIIFLGRIYPRPSVNNTSIIDIRRCLGKIHISTRPMDHTKERIIYDKASSLFITDSNTPLISTFSHSAITLLKAQFEGLDEEQVLFYWAQISKDTKDVFPNPKYEETLDIVAKELNTTIEHIQWMESKILENKMKYKDATRLFDECYIQPNDDCEIEAEFRGENRTPNKSNLPILSKPKPKPLVTKKEILANENRIKKASDAITNEFSEFDKAIPLNYKQKQIKLTKTRNKPVSKNIEQMDPVQLTRPRDINEINALVNTKPKQVKVFSSRQKRKHMKQQSEQKLSTMAKIRTPRPNKSRQQRRASSSKNVKQAALDRIHDPTVKVDQAKT